MFGVHDLPAFIASGLLLNMAPGPDSLLIATRSAQQGWRAGSAAALGIGTGTCVHIAAGALGLSALLATSAAAFAVVKYLGAAYLLYLGVSMLLSRSKRTDTPKAVAVPMPYRRIFAQGIITNLLNPKIALFFLAFIPQFIAGDATNKSSAFVLLGLIFNLNGMLWCNGLALAVGAAGQRIRFDGPIAAWINRAIGAMFVTFGARLAASVRT